MRPEACLDKRLRDVFTVNPPNVGVTALRLIAMLHEHQLDYAVAGSLAVLLHRGRQFRYDLDVCLTQASCEHLRSAPNIPFTCFGSSLKEFGMYETQPTDSAGMWVDVWGELVPDVLSISEIVLGARVLRLPELLARRLTRRGHAPLAEVVSLIRAHGLDESFLDQLRPALHDAFLRCLEEVRWDDEYKAREGIG